jgi:hypothetical protein
VVTPATFLNRTPATPPLSEARAETVTVPETVAAGAGALSVCLPVLDVRRAMACGESAGTKEIPKESALDAETLVEGTGP